LTIAAGTRLGAYQILEKLGEGGMGEVYRAHDTALNRVVALKILSADLTQDGERLRRFRLEAQAASGLNHPNILTIYEAGAAQGHEFIATEFVDGETLRQILQRRGRLPVAEALAIAAQVASALNAAHHAGIVHRDIKPENVMVRRDRYVKVLDFGIAKLIERDDKPSDQDALTTAAGFTKAGAIVGTVPYMSPEQARGTAVDARTDIWSLGCLLYEMIAGRQPFAGPTASDVLVAILDKEPAPVVQLAVGAPAECDWIIAKTLRKSPAERYQTMEELFGDVRRLQQRLEIDAQQERVVRHGDAQAEPASSSREHEPQRTATARLDVRRPAMRPRIGVAAVVVLVAALSAGWYWWRMSPGVSAAARSLVVLPLKSLDATDDYLGLGIADAVIRKTSQAGGLIVRPTSAVRRYVTEETDALTAARQLSADVVLEGSVQRAGDRLRVSVNLLRVGDGVSIWADSFDMRMTDIFQIQDTVAQQVASHLRLTLDPSRQTRLARGQTANPLAYEFYLKGLHQFDQRLTLTDAQRTSTADFFLKAIEADPNFALAHAQLAYVYSSSAVISLITGPAFADKAKLEIERAQALDPDLPEIALARYRLLASRYEGFQSAAAVRVLRDAGTLDPTVGLAELGYLYTHLGLPDLSERVLLKALEIDPTSQFAIGQLMNVYEFSAQYDRWFAAQQRFHPNEPMDPGYFLATGRLDDAQRGFDAAAGRDGSDRFRGMPDRALLDALRGDTKSAEAAIPAILGSHPVKDLFYHHAAYFIACIYAVGGKSADAVKWLREAGASGFSPYPLFERVHFFDRIRQTAEFTQFMTELKATTEGYRREFDSAR
jgi:serine/threonine-protein kinase